MVRADAHTHTHITHTDQPCIRQSCNRAIANKHTHSLTQAYTCVRASPCQTPNDSLSYNIFGRSLPPSFVMAASFIACVAYVCAVRFLLSPATIPNSNLTTVYELKIHGAQMFKISFMTWKLILAFAPTCLAFPVLNGATYTHMWPLRQRILFQQNQIFYGPVFRVNFQFLPKVNKNWEFSSWKNTKKKNIRQNAHDKSSLKWLGRAFPMEIFFVANLLYSTIWHWPTDFSMKSQFCVMSNEQCKSVAYTPLRHYNTQRQRVLLVVYICEWKMRYTIQRIVRVCVNKLASRLFCVWLCACVYDMFVVRCTPWTCVYAAAAS